ncbi:tyrosine-type recombinase/integrase [Mycobacterium sp. NPDC050041]|uniref:tyrosine-type recombinase/integrase n=1 Tax=Mycobacterium sp. NPDC050041 TaxID=3364293 RepID=UPI003C2B214C
MASLRFAHRKDGSVYTQVLYRHDGRQRSLSFDDHQAAVDFRSLIDQVGVAKALEVIRVEPDAPRRLTVEDWLTHHIDHLTGVDPNTLAKYRAYVRNDIAPLFGAMPLAALDRDDIAKWVNTLADAGAAGKTVANKHGFLSGALNAAVAAGHIPANPCDGRRLPRTEQQEMVFLTREQFGALHDATTAHWQPLVEFLVASGCRWGEAAALQPGDVDRAQSTVRITKAWKYGSGGYRLGPPKTRKSKRTINVPATVLDKLDYTGEWLFTNRAGGPVRAHGFTRRVWAPAVKRAALDPTPRIHDLRHTCASWMIAAGVPLPVIQQHLGHESIQTTIGVYGHLDRRSSQAAADAISAMLS